jgi:hypothetical protein
VHNGLIGYKNFDSITTSTFFGYKTQFSYFKEFDNQNITNEQTIKNQCGI